MPQYPQYPQYRRRSLPTFRPQPQLQPRPLLTSRYAKLNPLLRWFNLQTLAEPLSAPLRASLIHAWQHPGRFLSEPAIQSRERQRPPLDTLRYLPAWKLDSMACIELAVARRIVEIPRTTITSEERSYLLREQGIYLAHIYHALAAQLGEAAAQEVFARHAQAV